MSDEECITMKIYDNEDGTAGVDFYFGEGGLESWEGTNAGQLLAVIANVISQTEEKDNDQTRV